MSNYPEYEIGYNSVVLSTKHTYILDSSYSDDYIQGVIDAFTDKNVSKFVKRLAWKPGTSSEQMAKFKPTEFGLYQESRC